MFINRFQEVKDLTTYVRLPKPSQSVLTYRGAGSIRATVWRIPWPWSGTNIHQGRIHAVLFPCWADHHGAVEMLGNKSAAVSNISSLH